MTEETSTTQPGENNNASVENTDIQNSVQKAHHTAEAHFDQRQTNENIILSPTKEALQQDVAKATKIIQDLHSTIQNNTATSPTAEAMQSDEKKAVKTQKDIDNGKDPLAAYADYSAYAIPQTKENSHETPLTYDKYTITEDKNEQNIKYNLTELTLGEAAKATNNENAFIGSNVEEKSFEYHEKKSGNNTIITTEQTLKGTHTPSSYHIENKEEQITTFSNTQQDQYVYDKNDKLTEHLTHRHSDNQIFDMKAISRKGQDMSRGDDKGYCHTVTEIRTGRNTYTSFYQGEYDKNRQLKQETNGTLKQSAENYSHRNGENTITVSYGQNDKGEWTYTGVKGKIKDDKMTNTETLTPQQAQKEFKKLQKKVNKEIKSLTGKGNLSEYANQLGEPKTSLSLDALWSNSPTAESKERAEQLNEEVTQKYTNTPAAIVALKQQRSR